MTHRPSVILFRRDLRLADNPALAAAASRGGPVIPLFVLDETEPFAPRGAGRWWLHHSLARLTARFRACGAPLILRRGAMIDEVRAVIRETGAAAAFWNRRYEPVEIEADKALKAGLSESGVEAHSFNGALIREPWEVKTGAGGPYQVYTPYSRALRGLGAAREHVAAPKAIATFENPPRSDDLSDWSLLPHKPDWAAEFPDGWTPGEEGAINALGAFLDGAAKNYALDRDRPDLDGVSRLSPHLAFGEISVLTLWRAVEIARESGRIRQEDADKYLSELAWREFSYHLLYHNPEIAEAPLRDNFRRFPWRDDRPGFTAWSKGLTGYPIVDAGMRQLWRTGWMHNRVRMITASFLVKDMLIDWRLGEKWFRDTLVDADAANNPANWQWVAGCGADASPWFRIFNPVTQGEKFDPQGDYVRRFAPELSKLPPKYIHKPWQAPAETLEAADVKLGVTYPAPIVDHGKARQRALQAYEALSKTD